MVITYILAGALAGAIIAATYYRRELKKSDRLVEILKQDKNGLANRAHADYMKFSNELREEKKKLSETCVELRSINKLVARGHEHLQIRENMGFGLEHGFVYICGTTHDSNRFFIVKQFVYDHDDPDGRDFAIREAEELIETIQKA